MVCAVPLLAALFVPTGLDVWPLAVRVEMAEAFVAGSVMAFVGIRLLDAAHIETLEREAELEIVRDTERATAAALRRSEHRYRAIVETATEGIWVSDLDGRTTFANDRAAEIFGFAPSTMIGRNVLEVMDIDVRDVVIAYLERSREPDQHTPPPTLGDVPARRADGQEIWLSVAAINLIDETGTQTGTLAMFTDVTDRHLAEDRLRMTNEALDLLASLDPLTGIENRRALELALDGLATSRRGVSILLADIDHFKRFNDDNGHQAGDEALRQVARGLADAIRPGDRVFRYGGEEFLILLNGADTHAARTTAERCRRTVASHHIRRAPGVSDVLTVSVGVAVGRPTTTPIRVIVAAADDALYAAKGAGRDRVHVAESLVPAVNPTTPAHPTASSAVRSHRGRPMTVRRVPRAKPRPGDRQGTVPGTAARTDRRGR